MTVYYIYNPFNSFNPFGLFKGVNRLKGLNKPKGGQSNLFKLPGERRKKKMKMRNDETVSEYVQRLLAMVDRRKRDAEIIREWKGLPKKQDTPEPKGKSDKKFHSPERR